MLLSGEIAAAIGVQVDSPDVKPLIPIRRRPGCAALRARGLFPINHTIVVKDELLAANPTLAPDLFDAFAAAKRIYVERLRTGEIEQPSATDETFTRVMEMTGDPLPYGIEPNRAVLEAVVRHSVEQGILSRPFAVEELFAGTHVLATLRA